MTWFLKLTKRLYKRVSFIIIILLVPIMAYCINFASGLSHGLVGIALVGGDDVAQTIKSDIINSSELIRFEKMSYDDAKKALATSKVDAIWVFYDDTQKRIEEFVENGAVSPEIATVILREQTTQLRLANEKLSGAIFKQVAKQKYLDFAKSTLDGQYTDSELMEFYNSSRFTGDLFKTVSVSKNQTDFDYLVSPLRGLLSVIAVVSGLAACVHLLKDRQNGTFFLLTKSRRFYVEVTSVFIAVLSVSLISVAALAVSGTVGNIFYELLSAVVVSFAICAFCTFILNALPTVSRLGSAIPLAVIGCLTISPIFITLPFTKAAAFMFPTTFCLGCAYDPRYLVYAFLYTVILFVISHFIYKIKE